MPDKSTPSQEFLESWKEYMPDCPISETELRKPTEMSFRHNLLQILNQLHVDTALYDTMNLEIGTRLRALRFKLMSTVNYFLAIPACSKKMELNYLNLINPTFKIVFTTLRYLLNYSFFVNMIYANNITESAKKVEKFDQLRSIKNQLRKDIEEAKIKEEQCIKMFRELEKRIPQQKGTIAALQEKEERYLKEIQKIEQEIEQTDMALVELKSQKSSLSENVVGDSEAESIYASKESAQRQLYEHEEYIMAGRQKLKENSIAVEKIRLLTSKMETIQSEFLLDTSDIKTTRKHLLTQELSLNGLRNSIKMIGAEIESLTLNIKARKENVKKLNQKKDKIEATVGSKDKANLETLKQQVIRLHQLSSREDELLNVKLRLKDEFDLLYKISSNVVKEIGRSLYE